MFEFEVMFGCRCPLCGNRLRLCDDPCPDRPVQPTLRLRPRRHRRVRSQRSGSDPSIPQQGVGVLQLPAIVSRQYTPRAIDFPCSIAHTSPLASIWRLTGHRFKKVAKNSIEVGTFRQN